MKQLDWVMSDGGPLILMERRLKPTWGGILHCSSDKGLGAETDYERACSKNALVFTIPLAAGRAVVFGDMPLNTTWWQSANGCFFVIRLIWAERTAGIESMLSTLDSENLPLLEDETYLTVETTDFVLFDAAASDEEEGLAITLPRPIDRYKISTFRFDPDSQTSMYVHKFTQVIG